MVRLLTRLFAGPMLIVAVAAQAQLRFSTPKKISADVGINTVNAPVPTPVPAGQKAFISYELGDVIAFPEAHSGGLERAYGEFYSAMKTWGRYELVSDPSQADIVFAVRFVDPPNTVPQIRIGEADARTHIWLWGFVKQVDFKFRKKNRDLAFMDSVKLLVTDLQTLVRQTGRATPAQP